MLVSPSRTPIRAAALAARAIPRERARRAGDGPVTGRWRAQRLLARAVVLEHLSGFVLSACYLGTISTYDKPLPLLGEL